MEKRGILEIKRDLVNTTMERMDKERCFYYDKRRCMVHVREDFSQEAMGSTGAPL